MKKVTKNILAVAGIISTFFGLVVFIPSLLGDKYGISTGASALIVAGLVLLAIAFGD